MRSLKNRRRAAYTLIELLTVMFVIGLLLALVMGLYRHAQDAGNRRRAQADLGELHHALQRYYLRYGGYPGDPNLDTPAPEELRHATNLLHLALANVHDADELSDWLPPGFTALDPWNRPYQYEYQTNRVHDYTLYSLGFDPSDPSRKILFHP